MRIVCRKLMKQKPKECKNPSDFAFINTYQTLLQVTLYNAFPFNGKSDVKGNKALALSH